MDAEREIRNAQQDWARSKGIPFHSRGYVLEVEANLWQPLSPRARQGFERGITYNPPQGEAKGERRRWWTQGGALTLERCVTYIRGIGCQAD